MIKRIDENGIVIYYKNTHGVEHFYEYDEDGEFLCLRVFSKHFNLDNTYLLVNDYCDIELEELTPDDVKIITPDELEEIKCKRKEKEFLGRKEVPRFELMEVEICNSIQ